MCIVLDVYVDHASWFRAGGTAPGLKSHVCEKGHQIIVKEFAVHLLQAQHRSLITCQVRCCKSGLRFSDLGLPGTAYRTRAS